MYPQDNYTRSYQTQRSSISFPAVMQKVYTWMALALVITALTSMAVATQTGLIQQLFFTSRLPFYLLIGAELGVVWYLTARIGKMSFATAGILFALYSILNGVTLSFIFIAYETSSIINAFLTTAGTFGAMSLVGLFIKKDLSTIGRMLYMALFGLIIALIVNMFIGSGTFDLIISLLGVLIFTGLTAYDTQKIKLLVTQYADADEESTMKVALMGSLTLYLDFINLFLYILRLFGSRRS